MPHQISDELLVRFSDFLAARIGLSFPPKRWPDLRRGIKAAARDLGCDRPEQCIRQLMLAPLARKHIEILASHLTVGETYFFREKKSLAVLENHILPELVRDRRQQGQLHLRIWDAGCASGEEAYTLAILLGRLIADLEGWQIHILATDINPLALQKAARGLYDKWSFRDTPPEIIERYFVRREGRWEILPHLKGLVTFAYHNLVADPYPALANQTNAMDLILCRNVLMYFAAAQARKVLYNLGKSLVEGGWLIIGLTETSMVRFSSLVTVNFPGATVYRKDSGAKQIEPGAACPTPRPVVNLGGQEKARLDFPRAQDRLPAWPTRPPEVMPTPFPELLAPGPGDEVTAAVGEGALAGRVEDLVRKARSCADLGDLNAALSWCEQAVAADRLNPAWHYLRAAILQEQDAWGEAALSLKNAVYLDQDFIMAHFALGNVTLRQVVRRWPKAAARLPRIKVAKTPKSIEVVALGASTGGPLVLKKILEGLGADFPAPVLMVQHMSPGFVAGLAEWLQQSTKFPVQVGRHGEQILPGNAYLAPDGCHMGIDRFGRIELNTTAPVNGLRPAIAPLFRSVAERYGPHAVGILLTGMGADGAAELATLKEKGAITIAQDKESSVIHGIPGEAIKLGAAMYVLAPEQIAELLKALTNHDRSQQ